MFQGFKQFILKGNAVDLAVAVVIGVSFGAVVNAVVKDMINPLIGAFGGQPNFSSISLTINHSKFLIGDFLNAFVAFLINSSVIYFFVISPINKLTSLSKRDPVDPTIKQCPQCLSDIPAKAKRCAFCTSRQTQK